jgi:thiol-disulfide isomerase/thioredoxin
VLVVVLVLATAVGVLVTRRNGHFRGAARTTPGSVPDDGAVVLDADDLPAPLGTTATLLQFSSAFCAPCRATRRVLAEVADMVPGVVHVEVDAEHNLGLVRTLGVMRTPTTFVLDSHGAVVTRASGPPRVADVVAALGQVVR